MNVFPLAPCSLYFSPVCRKENLITTLSVLLKIDFGAVGRRSGKGDVQRDWCLLKLCLEHWGHWGYSVPHVPPLRQQSAVFAEMDECLLCRGVRASIYWPVWALLFAQSVHPSVHPKICSLLHDLCTRYPSSGCVITLYNHFTLYKQVLLIYIKCRYI